MGGWTGWTGWTGLDPLRSLVPLEHLAVLIIITRISWDIGTLHRMMYRSHRLDMLCKLGVLL